MLQAQQFSMQLQWFPYLFHVGSYKHRRSKEISQIVQEECEAFINVSNTIDCIPHV